jgi:quercetin dioxygenase-like cupin family protein
MDPRSTPIVLGPDEGRTYSLGTMSGVFKADEEETAAAYSISEWWLEPHSHGPGLHSHTANDDIFYVIEGTVRFLLGDRTIDAQKGAFLRIPPGVVHDFMNETDSKAGLLNIYVPGGFEREMPAIADWFRKRDALAR